MLSCKSPMMLIWRLLWPKAYESVFFEILTAPCGKKFMDDMVELSNMVQIYGYG